MSFPTDNGIGDIGSIELAKALKANTTLRQLNLESMLIPGTLLTTFAFGLDHDLGGCKMGFLKRRDCFINLIFFILVFFSP